MNASIWKPVRYSSGNCPPIYSTRSIRLGRFAKNSKALPANELISVPGGSVGNESENDGLDNEYGNYTSDVADFNASKYLVLIAFSSS